MTWLICKKPKSTARVRLVCFPYAGGNASTYRGWDELLPPTIEMHLAQLPGRMPRFGESPLTSIDSLADALAPAVAKIGNGLPTALFGHSMGAIVAFEVARRLSRMAGSNAAHLFVSARQAPQLPWRRRMIHALPERDFLAALADMEGTPTEVLADRELMELAMPALRADFTAIENYRCVPGQRLTCGISAFGGQRDRDVGEDDLLAWQDQTSGMALVEMLPGGHFFIEKEAPTVIKTIIQDLAHL